MEMICPICDEILKFSFAEKVLCKHEAIYDYCPSCGFLRARDPYWLAEAYSSAITSTDTGLVVRNSNVARKLASVLYGVLGERGQGRFVDIAGGYGMLTRMMRDYGYDFYWSDKYCANLMARGFEYSSELGACVAVTAIEIIEHVEDPIAFICDALKQTQANTFIFTTELFEGLPPSPEHWWYYSFETGQHIAFYQRKTLEIMAKKLGLFFASRGGIHIFSKSPINESMLGFFASRVSNIFCKWVSNTFGTKVMKDHLDMVQRLRDLQ
jgi:hypothetical protein